jgi:hypothetical protein
MFAAIGGELRKIVDTDSLAVSWKKTADKTGGKTLRRTADGFDEVDEVVECAGFRGYLQYSELGEGLFRD